LTERSDYYNLPRQGATDPGLHSEIFVVAMSIM
jgi:hypothetical protein